MSGLLWQGTVLVALFVTASCETKLATFEAISSDYTATPIDNPREMQSLIECARFCYYGYMRCYSVTYNTQSGACTPREWIMFNSSSSDRSPQELLYHIDRCNATLEFQLFVYKSVIQCLYISRKQENYTNARDICTMKGGVLMLVKSNDKMELLRTIIRDITRNRTWIGLNDMATENTFIWEDNEPAGKLPWRPDQPDNANGLENCVEIGSANDYIFINDFVCSETCQYICETDKLI